MRRTVFLTTMGVAALACSSFLFAAEEAKSLALGSAVPMADQKMKNVDGREVSIADARGPKGTLVIFTCNACPWAKAWEERIVALGNDSRNHPFSRSHYLLTPLTNQSVPEAPAPQ